MKKKRKKELGGRERKGQRKKVTSLSYIKDGRKKERQAYYFLTLHLHHFSKIKVMKVFLTIFASG
jgi:hypothetical protein